MTDEQEMELHEELKWAKTEAGQAHAMVASLQEKLRASAAENERLRANLYQEEAETEALETKLEAIAAENERLREALKPFAEKFLFPDDTGFAEEMRAEEGWSEEYNDSQVDDVMVERSWIRKARNAMGGK